jgi:3-oxoacyl-[acyl-carrier protein] reductase
VVAETLAQFGRLDVLINNAGGSQPTAADAPDAVWEESWALNFTAVRRLTQACLPAMQRQQWGRIINITGSSKPSGINAANPAKAAVHVWAKGLSRVVGRDGITVNCLAPGRIHSEQIDQRIHPTEESQRAFAGPARLLRGAGGHSVPGGVSVLAEGALHHGRAHPRRRGLPPRLLTELLN